MSKQGCRCQGFIFATEKKGTRKITKVPLTQSSDLLPRFDHTSVKSYVESDQISSLSGCCIRHTLTHRLPLHHSCCLFVSHFLTPKLSLPALLQAWVAAVPSLPGFQWLIKWEPAQPLIWSATVSPEFETPSGGGGPDSVEWRRSISSVIWVDLPFHSSTHPPAAVFQNGF